MSSPTTTPIPAAPAPLTPGRTALIAAGGALTGAAVMFAGNYLPFAVLTYPLDGSSDSNNLFIARGLVAIALAVFVSWFAFRGVHAYRPIATALIGVALAIPITVLVSAFTSVLLGMTGAELFQVVAYIVNALACAALYLLVARAVRRRAA